MSRARPPVPDQRFTYDLADEQLSATDPVGARTEATYDDLGRQITQTQLERYPAAAAYTTRLAYDDAGNLTTRTRPAGDTTAYTTNGAGDTTQITDTLGHTSTFAYDLAGRLTKATDPRGAATVAVVTPYQEPVNRALAHFLLGWGIRVDTLHTLAATDIDALVRIGADSVRQLALEAMRPGCDALLLACSQLPTRQLLPALEQSIGHPTWSSAKSTAWLAANAFDLGEVRHP